MTLSGELKSCRKFLLGIYLGLTCNLCMAGSQDANFDEFARSPEVQAYEQWGNEFLLYLAKSDTHWIRAAVATHLATRNDPALTVSGHQQFETVADLPTTDPLALWHLARYCRAFKQSLTCEIQQIMERLGRADPKNIAPLLVVDQHLSGDSWSNPDANSSTNRQLLESLAQAEVFDEYWGRGSFELLAAFEDYQALYPPPVTPELVKQFGATPSFWILLPITTMDGFSPGFSKLFKLCEAHANTGSRPAMQQCLEIARTLQLNSKTYLARNMGTAIEDIVHTAIDPASADALFVARKRAALRKSNTCAIPLLLQGRGDVKTDESTVENWTTDYFLDLDTLGETQAAQRLAEREYATFPDLYTSNPEDCPNVLGMSSSEMADYLGKDYPAIKIYQD